VTVKLAQPILIGAWFLIVANIIVSLVSIWMFNRMAPAIETIIVRNERSLQACEEMLAALSLTPPSCSSGTCDSLQRVFTTALMKAEGNITEPDEPQAITIIKNNVGSTYAGNAYARSLTVAAITQLGAINRDAMVRADVKARQIGSAGAWGVVFMATGVFLFGMIFLRKLTTTLLQPVAEIQSVLSASEKGDPLRRCSNVNVPGDFATVYSSINTMLDKNLQGYPHDRDKG